MNWCLYHSEQAQFLGPVTETRMPGPAGRYTCCGQQAFRYETLPGPMVKKNRLNFQNFPQLTSISLIYCDAGLPIP